MDSPLALPASSALGLVQHASARVQRPLRIAFFSDALPERNGAGSYYQDLCHHLRAHGVVADLYQPHLKKRLQMALPLPGDPTQKLLTPNVPKLWTQFAAQQPDVVIAITPGPFGLLGLSLAKRFGCSFLSAFHTQFEELSRLYWNPLSRRVANGYLTLTNSVLCRHSRSVMVHNRALIETVERLGARQTDVMGTPLAPCFLDVPRLAHRASLRHVLFAGRLAPEKNVADVVAAARQLPHIQFSIAGDGPLRRKLERQARDLPNVQFWGWLSRPELRALMDECDLLVLPSALETFGTIALEAMARGRPALVAEGAGIHDWPKLRDGLLVQQCGENVEAALRRVATLSADDWRMRGERARRAAERLNEDTVEQWIALARRHIVQ